MPQTHQTPDYFSAAGTGAEGVADGLTTWAGRWDLREGHHPAVAAPLQNVLATLASSKSALPSPSQHLASLNMPLSPSLIPQNLPLAPTAAGHHTVVSHGPRRAASEPALLQEDIWPLSPLFVRDLAGRILQTSPIPLPAKLPVHRFPAGSHVVPVDHPLNTAPDEEFLCHFRLLEWSPYHGVPLTGHPQHLVRALYPGPNQYPYKIRVDSFYQDGFRLPQTTRLAVQTTSEADAAIAAQEFENKWQSRPQGQSYEAFYEANDGTVWFEALFQRGCTVVPTFEAFNGFFKVTNDFGMLDVWPGRAVEGLHHITAVQPNAAPKGTILEVVKPGYIAQNQCIPAHVIVSSGSAYVSSNAADPAPMLPDLTLPHPRLAPVWGAT